MLALLTGLVGGYAWVLPHSFYRHVVGVDLLGPFNEHLLRDVGGFYLGFALLFAWACRACGRSLTSAACSAFALSQALHFAYHLTHLDDFTTWEAVAQTVSLAVLLILPLLGLFIGRRGAAQES